MAKITKHCKKCGTDHIVFDANAVWDVEKQEMVLDDTYNTHECFCCECDDVAHVVEKEVPDEASEQGL